MHWLVDTGLVDQTVDTLPSPAARLDCNRPVSGNDGGHDCNPPWLARRGAVLVGRVEGFEGSTVRLGSDPQRALAEAAEAARELLRRVDEYIEATGLDVPPAEPDEEGGHSNPVAGELDLGAAGISTILWANGFRPDYGWIELPVTDDYGWPVQTRGGERVSRASTSSASTGCTSASRRSSSASARTPSTWPRTSPGGGPPSGNPSRNQARGRPRPS